MSNSETVDHRKMYRVTLTQSVLRDRKNRYVLRGLIMQLFAKIFFIHFDIYLTYIFVPPALTG